MNKKDLMKVGVGIGVLALLYFAFKKKGTTAKSTSAAKSDDSTIKTTKVEGGSISIDEKEFLDNVKRKTEIQAGDSPKMIAIKKFSAEVFTNPPKSEQEFLARASKAGLSKADLQSPEAQKMLNPFSNFEDGMSSRAKSTIGGSRIKPTSVSGLARAKRPRNYGTAQRPTRKLMPTSPAMDFDGNDDVQGSIM
jgi:hypothetical protein